MKIVIIGAGGRLGSALMREYRDKFELVGFDHEDLDLGDEKKVVDWLLPLDFDVLINTAALTNVDYCETNRGEAFRINAEAPRVMAEICRDKNAKLIHFSTDYVFDGEKREPYREGDETRPISVYGESKREGEKKILATQGRHLVIRVSWVFGPDRPSFIDAMINRARESEHVDAIADKLSTPTYTRDIGEMLPKFFVAGIDDPGGSGKAAVSAPDYSGILHFANAGECSWQEYAQFGLDCCRSLGIPLKAKSVDQLKLAEMKKWTARRPAYSVLSTGKFFALTGDTPRTWRDAVADYIRGSYSKK